MCFKVRKDKGCKEVDLNTKRNEDKFRCRKDGIMYKVSLKNIQNEKE